ncbi:phospholipase/carboxylesterase [Rhodopseudomonas julia]|uniref:Phospholipase/carboxylesterase n=1 Tax=Rhodopseudomonas julia TaxID=200617 RepID=A0ABU0C6B8_9BRAD|nr:dienelactone hydrolase family protein [Rhodopseudomonas julia]MDQ0326073.1 phospholipase/carboxylesterase [Rhodopseudomonas julia]
MPLTLLDGPRIAPASGGAAKSLVVFLHGFGADGNDLIAIGREWARVLPDTAFVAPHAPEPCAAAPMGRQWFDLTRQNPEVYKLGVAEAAPSLDRFLDQEMQRVGVDETKTALVGFSQGTMMALHVGPLRPKKLAGIVGFSGLLADKAAIAAPEAQKPPVLLVHGDSDQLIPVQALFMANEGLTEAKIPVEWHISQGIGHGIGPDGLSLAQQFLQRVLGAA